MELTPEIVTPPSAKPVTLEELKPHVVTDFGDDDQILQAYLDAATSHIDGWDGVLGRALLSQTVKQSFGKFSRNMLLPYGRATQIVSVSYYDEANTVQTIDGAYLVQTGAGSVVALPSGMNFPRTYDRLDAVFVTYVAGWGTPELLPPSIKQAISLLAAHWYQNREAAVLVSGNGFDQIPFGVKDMLAPYSYLGI